VVKAGAENTIWRRDDFAMQECRKLGAYCRSRAFKFLEQGHMEHIVNMSTGWQLKPIGNLTNSCCHLIRSKEFWPQFRLGD
jgi:hypothetical protein